MDKLSNDRQPNKPPAKVTSCAASIAWGRRLPARATATYTRVTDDDLDRTMTGASRDDAQRGGE